MAASLAGKSPSAARGWCGAQRPLFQPFPMSGSFSHWMAALEQRNLSGRGNFHGRDFSLHFSGSRDLRARAEGVWAQHTRVCTVPAIDASLSALFCAPRSLPAPQNEVPWIILSRLLFPCGCREICWGLSWDSEPRPGAKQTQTGQGKEVSDLPVHQNHFLSTSLISPKPSTFQLLGCRDPHVKVTHPKLARFCTEKDLGPDFSMLVVEEAPKFPGTGKQSPSGHFSLPLVVLTPNISIHLWDFPDVVLGRGARAVLGGQGGFVLDCSPFAKAVQGKCSKAVFWPGHISVYRLPAGLALLLAHGQHRTQNHRNP